MIEWLSPWALAVDGVQVDLVGQATFCTVCADRELCRHALLAKSHLVREPAPAPDDPIWGDPPWPSWLKQVKPIQWEAIRRIVEAFREIPEPPRFVILEGPTGSGKTLIGEGSRRLLPFSGVASGRTRALYACITRSLQQQFLHDFPYGALLQGRNNYPTLDYPERFRAEERLSCADCDKDRGPTGETVCSWCSNVAECPYEKAKARALASNLAVVNVAYLLAEANFVGRFGLGPREEDNEPAFPRDLVIVDEADELEQEILRFVEVRIGRRLQRRIGIEPIADARTSRGDPTAGKTKPEAWANWLQMEVRPKLQAHRQELLAELRRMEREKASGILVAVARKLALQRSARAVERLWRRIGPLVEALRKGEWVYVPPEKEEDESIVFRPVRASGLAGEVLWRHAPNWLLMSATVLSPTQFANDLGIPDGHWRFVGTPSTFDPNRRPIFIVDGPRMSHADEEAAWPRLVPYLQRILDAYAGVRILVHTVSYRLARYLMDRLSARERLITYRSAEERDLALSAFKEREGAVLLAPSLDRGVDLPDDAARVVVVAKIPYPNLADPQVSARLHSSGGESWYTLATVRTLVQQCGRAMRHEDDWCHVYIIDGQFHVLKNKAWRLFPLWWRQAVRWDGGIFGGNRVG